MKKNISLILTIVLTELSGVTPVSAATYADIPGLSTNYRDAINHVSDHQSEFEDVKFESWYRDYVDYVKEAELFKGVSPSKFEPERSITRGEFVTVLFRMNTKINGADSSEQNDSSSFTDVPDESYYSEAVRWAKKNELVQGFPDGTFRPGAEIDRQSLATIISRYLSFAHISIVEPVDWFCGQDSNQSPVSLKEYSDCEEIAAWAKEAVERISKDRIMVGVKSRHETSDGQTADSLQFLPEKNVTRAETATVITRVYQAIRYAPDHETKYTVIRYSCEGDFDNQKFILEQDGRQIISDYEAWEKLKEKIRMFDPEVTVSETIDESYFEEKNLAVVELQSVGAAIFETRLANCDMSNDTMKVDFLTDSHGTTADVSGCLYLIEVPETVNNIDFQTAGFVHQVTDPWWT